MGWLEAEHPFPTGVVEDWVVRKLAKLLRKPYQPMCYLGWHDCSLCGGAQSTANLWLPGEGCNYVAPEMILHYIVAHEYAPPEPFLKAVRECPSMGSSDYHERLNANGFRTDAEDGGLYFAVSLVRKGCLDFRLASESGGVLEGGASYIVYDSLRDLAEAMLRLLAGRSDQEVRWFVGSPEYRFQFQPVGDRVRLRILVCDDRQASGGELVFEHEGPLRGVARTCYQALRRLEPAYSPELWFHYAFPTERLQQLGEALRSRV